MMNVHSEGCDTLIDVHSETCITEGIIQLEMLKR